MRNLFLLTVVSLTSFILTSCAGYNDALTPDSKIQTDSFDGSVTVIQKPVDALKFSELATAPHKLGFRWSAKEPNVIYLTAATWNIQNIQGLDFNVGGRFISAKTASVLTDMNTSTRISSRQFEVSYNDFKTILSAPVVKMKVSDIDTYTVSTFGTSLNTQVNRKAVSFIQQVESARGR